MMVRVNGNDTEIPDGTSVRKLVESMGLNGSRVAVEVDGTICPRSEHAERVLRGGERIEVVGFVGGG